MAGMVSPVRAEALRLTTDDDVSICARHLPRAIDQAIVVAHGFSGHCHSQRARAIAALLHASSGVISIDFRGHGHSGGYSTVGDLEVYDIEAAVAFARSRGYTKVAVAGFSMGAAVAIRHAALIGEVSAVAAISGPAHWYYRGTSPMRWLHRAIELKTGRIVARCGLRTRISGHGWNPPPLPPWQVSGKIAPTPLLVVHGTADRFFPLRHAHAIHDAAGDPRALWIEPGMGHAESAMTPDLIKRIGRWLNGPETAGVPPTS